MGISEYILKVNLAIFAGWLLYRLYFRRLTFFQWNRFYLLGSVVLSFILPLFWLPRGSRLAAAVDLSGIEWEYVDHLVQTPATVVLESAGISPRSLILGLYFTGVLLLMVLFVWRILKNRNLIRHATLVQDEGIKIYVLDGKNGSFTLFRRVYLDRYTWENQVHHVLRHEMVHASQLHFLDLFFLAFVGVLLWFNPFVFLLLRSARENHEYLADDQALREPGDLAGYLGCLRDETIRRYSPAVASYFKSSTIKKRIIMLTNHHTLSHKRWHYLAIIPVIALILMAFQSPEIEQVAITPSKGLEVIPGVSESVSSGEIPSHFPLPAEYRDNITWGHNQTAIHPINKKKVAHQGVDIAAPLGTNVFAASVGTVKKAELLEGWGNLLIIEHGAGYTTHYAHLKEFRVKKGDKVTKGQVVATVGSTGQSTGPHLHYEVRKEGSVLNPSDYY
jgi:biotin carboxyl carrier protein